MFKKKGNDKFKFSIIVPIFNSELYLHKSIDSIINQTLDFEENTQLILVNDGSTDSSEQICLEYQKKFPNNIIVLSQKNEGRSSARNLGIKYANGKYVNFLDSDDYFSENTLKEVSDFFEENNISIVSVPRLLFGRIKGFDELSKKIFSEKIIDLKNNPNYPLLYISSTFIRLNLLKDNEILFENMKFSEDSLFINQLLLKEFKYGVVNSGIYFYRQRLSLNGMHDSITFSNYYYLDRLDDFHEKLIELSLKNNDKVPNFIQFAILYDLKNIFTQKQFNTIFNEIQNPFLKRIKNILKNINEENIKNNEFLEQNIRKLFLDIKNKSDENVILETNNLILNKQKSNQIKVSIIIPVYNVEKYLEECLESVINQTLKEIEIICIDDGSTDKSPKILEEFSKKDSRIHIISKENEGQAIARNIGIKEAIGEYIGFIDSDDIIDKNMFKKLYENAHNNSLDIIMCKITTFDETNNKINEDDWYYSLKCFNGFEKKIFNHIDTQKFTDEISVTPVNKLYKRDFLMENNLFFPENLIFEDEVFFYDMYLSAKRISIYNENLYYYRINRLGSTVSLNTEKDFTDIIKVFQKIRKILEKNDLLKLYKKQVYNKFFHKILSRYSQTSEKYRPKFWENMKYDFTSILDFNESTSDNRKTEMNEFNHLKKEEEFLNFNSEIIDFQEIEDKLTSPKMSNEELKIKESKRKLNENDLEIRIKDRVLKVCSSNSYEEFKLRDSQKLFSIIIAVYNTEKYLDECIESIINQSIGFIHNVQLILIDDGSTDNSKNILLKYRELYPKNIIVLSQENKGQASARNLGMKYMEGKFINFLDSDDYLSSNTLKEVYEFFLKHNDEIDVVSIPLTQFGRINAPHILNYKFSKTRVIDLIREPNNPQLSASSSFIKAEALNNIFFPTTFMGSEDGHVMCKILLRKKKLGVLATSKYFYRRREDSGSTLDKMGNNSLHFTPRLKYHFMELINYSIKKYNEIPFFLQYSLIYDLQWILNISNGKIFNNSLEEEEFKFYINNILKFIDNKVILENKNIKNVNLKNYIYSIKNEKYALIENENVILKKNQKILDQLKIHKIWIDIVQIKDNHFLISGFFNSLFNRNNISIILEKRNGNHSEIFVGEYMKYTSRPDNKFLLDIWQYNTNFNIKVPLLKNEESEMHLLIYYHKDGNNSNFDDENLIKFNLVIDFTKFCLISNKNNYIANENIIVSFKKNIFYISNYSYKKMFKLENAILENLKNSENEVNLEAFRIRRLYLYLYPFVRLFKKFRQIYLYMDRQDMAGDNAEQLFNYSKKEKDNILKYFIIDKESTDFNRLKSHNVVPFNSRKHKLLYLFADKLIVSHPDEDVYNPFFKKYMLFSNLFTSKKYFLQHGVTKDDISNWLRKYDKNLSLITTVSKLEQNSFFNQNNGYEKNIIQLLGFPRYDKLNNENNKKQILIMPTWINRDFNEETFKNTKYFKELYHLLHSKELYELCEKHDYAILFKPHPNLIKYLDLFEIPDYIQISLNRTYAELFNESSLLITDYSSVSFDFAYLKKPIIYYQYYNYYNFDLEKSYFKYDKIGFGEVINEEKSLLEKIEYYLNNECKMEKEFIERVDNFFEYKDKENSKRNYDWIKNH